MTPAKDDPPLSIRMKCGMTVGHHNLIYIWRFHAKTSPECPPQPRHHCQQGQTEQILHQIDDLLAEAGTDRSKLVQVAIWLKTMDDYDGFNAVWDAWVIPGHTPTRACGEVKMADDDMLVEIIAVAAL